MQSSTALTSDGLGCPTRLWKAAHSRLFLAYHMSIWYAFLEPYHPYIPLQKKKKYKLQKATQKSNSKVHLIMQGVFSAIKVLSVQE